MKFKIMSESNCRLRIQLLQRYMSYEQADTLFYYVRHLPGVTFAKVSDRTCTLTIKFIGDKWDIVDAIQKFDYERFAAPEEFIANSSRRLNAAYQDKLFIAIAKRLVTVTVTPIPVRVALTIAKSLKYIKAGIKSLVSGKIEVALLDGVAVGVSVLRRDFNTASSVMFLLGVG